MTHTHANALNIIHQLSLSRLENKHGYKQQSCHQQFWPTPSDELTQMLKQFANKQHTNSIITVKHKEGAKKMATFDRYGSRQLITSSVYNERCRRCSEQQSLSSASVLYVINHVSASKSVYRVRVSMRPPTSLHPAVSGLLKSSDRTAKSGN